MNKKDYSYIYNSVKNRSGSDKYLESPIYIRGEEVATKNWAQPKLKEGPGIHIDKDNNISVTGGGGSIEDIFDEDGNFTVPNELVVNSDALIKRDTSIQGNAFIHGNTWIDGSLSVGDQPVVVRDDLDDYQKKLIAGDNITIDGNTISGTVYTLPVASLTALGGVKSSVTGTTSGRDYNVQINTDGTMKVNVPWENTTYTNATTTKAGLMSATDKTNHDKMWNVWSADGSDNTLINKVEEVLKAFENTPEGTNIINALESKADKTTTYTKTETDNLLNNKIEDIYLVASTDGIKSVSGTTSSMADDQTQGGIGATYYATGTTNIGTGCSNVTISKGSCTYNTSTGEVSWKIPGLRANQSVSATITWEGGTALATIKDGVEEKIAHFNTINGQSIVNTDGTVNITVPTKTSQLTNDIGFLTEHQDISGKADKTDTYTKSETDNFLNNKANKSDIPTKVSDLTNDSGFTTNKGTVTSVRVQAGTGLSSSTSTAQTGTLNTTISVASGYKLPTTEEWNSKGTSNLTLGTTSTTAAKGDHNHDSSYVAKNSAITGATKAKITYDSKGLVTGGADLSASDIPSLAASKITSGTFADARIASAATWNAKQDAITTTNKLGTDKISGLAAVATSGSYNDLANTPTIPSAVTEATVAGWGFTKNTGTSNFSGSYNDLTNKPTIPTKTSQLTNDSGYLTSHQDISGKADKATTYTKTETDNLLNNKIEDIYLVASSSGSQLVGGRTGTTPVTFEKSITYYTYSTTINIGYGCVNVTVTPFNDMITPKATCTYDESTGNVKVTLYATSSNTLVSSVLTWEGGGCKLVSTKNSTNTDVLYFNTINGQSIVNTDGTVNIEVGGDIDLSNYSTKNETVSDVWINEDEPDMLYITKGGSDYEYPLPSVSLYRHFIMLSIDSSEENWTVGQYVHFEILNRRSIPYTTEAQVASALNDYGTVPCSATNSRNDYTDARLVYSDGFDIVIEIANGDAECVTARVTDSVKPI